MYTDKVYTGLDHAPAAFDLRGRILGPNGNNLDYIKSETGAQIIIKGGSGPSDPLHVVLQHVRTDGVTSARSLTVNLIETVKNELQQWSSQTGQAVPAAPETPSVSAGTAPDPIPLVNIAPAATAAPASSPMVTIRQQPVLQLMPQQQYILNQDGSQLIPLIQSGQMPGQGNFTQLIGSFPQTSSAQFVDANLQPINMGQIRLGGIPNSMQSFIQNGLPMSQVSLASQDTTTVSYTSLLPVSSTVSSPSAGAGPVVHATQTSGQKVQWSTEKVQEKATEMKYHYQMAGGEPVQLSVPGSTQTMYIPYQQLQELTASSGAGFQPQFVSISASGGVSAFPAGTQLPLQQITMPPGATLHPNILHLNQKPSAANTSVINLWSAQPGGGSMPAQITPAQQIITPQAGQVWSSQQMQVAASQGTTLTPIPAQSPWIRAPGVPAALPQGAELIPLNTPLKVSGQDARAQKRLSDGTPTQIQLRPIAPAGSQVHQQDKSSGARDSRPVVWTASTGRDISGNTVNQSTQKSSGSRGSLTISSSSTPTSAGTITISTQDRTASPARQVEKNAAQTSLDGTPKSADTPNKISTLPNNIQMYTVSNNGQPIQSISHIPTSLAPNASVNQMYLTPTSQGAALQSVGLPQNAMMGQTLQVGQGNVPLMQSNQLGLPHGVQYNTVPLMQLPQQMQYITPGYNFNNSGQQLSLTMPSQQVLSPAMLANLQSNNPNQIAHLNQASMQALSNQVSPNSQTPGNVQYSATPLQNTSQHAPQFVTPNSQQVPYVVPTSQYGGTPAQFATHQGNFILPAQGSIPLQYNLVNQTASPSTQVNPTIQPGESRGNIANANQPSSYTSVNPNGNQQTVFGQGVNQQSFPQGTPVAQATTHQAYPTVDSPSAHQPALAAENSANPQANNYPTAVAQNQIAGFSQTNTPSNSFQNGNTGQTGTPIPFSGNQYAVSNNSKTWTGQRPSGNVAQYAAPRASQPAAPAAPSANANYWQYS